MICPDCLKAGKLLAKAEAAVPHSDEWHWNRTYAAEAHNACLERHMKRQGPDYQNIRNTWCDCLHSMTSSLNRLLVPIKEVSE